MLHSLPRLHPNSWRDTTTAGGHARGFSCGYCNHRVSSEKVYLGPGDAQVYICPSCGNPSYFTGGYQVPGHRPGRDVSGLPETIGRLYEESRTAIGAGTFTAAALILRVLLIHIASERGMKGGGSSYKACVSFLVSAGYVAKNEESFVDQVRVLGNAANHELGEVTLAESEQALAFMEHLLLGLYEYPARAAAPKAKP